MDKSDFQELLASLYLRLNGYFVSGFIVHAPEGELGRSGIQRPNRAELDILAVRFPYNTEPERNVLPSSYLQTSAEHIDIIIGEVKGSNKELQFNRGLRTSDETIRSVLRWIGIIPETEVDNHVQNVKSLLSTQVSNDPRTFRTYEFGLDNCLRIRAIFFAPDRDNPPQPGQTRYINGQELIDYIWTCLHPDTPRSSCVTRYEVGLWGPYTEIVKFFKDRNRPSNIEEIYQYLLAQNRGSA